MQIARFLAENPPFDQLDQERLERVAGRARIAFFEHGSSILEQGGEPVHHLYVVRTGRVELVDDGHVIDELGPGEPFGHPSLLSGLGPSLDVRAVEDTLCYLIDPEDATELLATRPGLRFLSQSLRRRAVRALQGAEGNRADPWRSHVGALVKRPTIAAEPGWTVSNAAAVMARERISSLIVPLADGALGIVTDRDLRARVLATGRTGDTPLGEIASTPLVTVEPEAPLAEVLGTMLEHAIHHLPVVDEDGRLLGVVTDTDLMGVERTTPFHLRSAIERASTKEEAIEAARLLPRTVEAAVDGDVDPVDVGHMIAVTVDALTRRLIDLAIQDLGDPPGSWAWIALGSEARHEQALATDQDHALAYDVPEGAVDRADTYFVRLAQAVTAGIEAAGIPRCRANVSATNPGWRGTVEAWRARFTAWIEDTGFEGLTLTAIAFDHRRVHGTLPIEAALEPIVRSAHQTPLFLRRVMRGAVETRPPTGFLRDFVVRSDGEHAGTLDVKHGGITLITSLARAGALAAGSAELRTPRRLRAAAAAGSLDAETAAALEESFSLLWQIRLEHQSAQSSAGEPADDFVDPKRLPPLTRHALKEAFRTIDRAQRSLAAQLGIRAR